MSKKSQLSVVKSRKIKVVYQKKLLYLVSVAKTVLNAYYFIINIDEKKPALLTN
jgi:hypothetical protein